ncbi:uncharacterized protein LOC122054216 [Zingiber officinale]|uniref:uncharacterized protein LOC122054216 n=1 Tax=Zingiber officinale TaxID=94328 RepID=UPI001C4D5F0F|nr:uncharacterized protein LOC122054216 [Zingiber officinale]
MLEATGLSILPPFTSLKKVNHCSSYFHPCASSRKRLAKKEGRGMGNCQASEVATVVIQHPGGKAERLYWPTTAADVMRSNPGYYVALVTLYVSEEKDGGAVRFTRARLLKAKDMLLLGQVYRLIASQEITKAVRQRKHAMLKKSQEELIRKQQQREQRHGKIEKQQQEDSENSLQVARQGRDRQRSSAQMAGRGRHWRPSLRSISETVS